MIKHTCVFGFHASLVGGVATMLAIASVGFAYSPACSCDIPGGIGCPPNIACQQCVCAQDPFCCDIAWDGICVRRALNVCVVECCDMMPNCSECTGDLNFDGHVGVPDLLLLHACWGPGSIGCECADHDNSGNVGVPDLFALLNNWGECPPPPPPIDCCAAHGGIGCPNDFPCELCVCAQDAFCCNVSWDGICGGRAIGVCCDSCQCCEG